MRAQAWRAVHLADVESTKAEDQTEWWISSSWHLRNGSWWFDTSTRKMAI